MKSKKDYQKLFAAGIVFVGVGVTFSTTINRQLGIVLIAVGGIFMLAGIRNKDEWKTK